MDEGRLTPRDRLREEQKARDRRRRTSLVAGAVGLGALFGGGIAIVAVPGWIVPLTVIMALGVVLLALAFFLAPGSTFARLARRLHDRQIGKE